MAMHPVQPLNPGPSTSGTGIVSIGPAGSTYTSMEQSGRSLLKTYCDDFPNTDKSFVIPPMFNSVYTEVMPENSRGLNRKEKNKYKGAQKNQDGEKAEKMIYDMINEIIRKDKSSNPSIALFNVKMDNDNKTKVRKLTLLSELNGMDFTDIKTSGEFDCIIVAKDLGTIHIEVKRTNNVSNIASAEDQLDSGVQFVTNLMNAIKGSQSTFPFVRLIAIPCEASKSPSCKTALGSFVAHSDVCQNFTSTWNKMMKELEASATRNQFTDVEFKTFCNILMGWYCSEPVKQGLFKGCISNDSCLSLPKQVAYIDEKVQRAEMTSEEQKAKKESEKQTPLSDIVRTNLKDIFQNSNGIGLLYLTPTQNSLYYQFPHAIVHGHGGTGKTILCLMKMMDLVRSGANRRALFVAPTPSHLYCRSILVKNKFNACIVKEVPLSKEVKCDIAIITLNDFFNDAKIADASNLSEYDIFFDDLQDYYTENLCNDSNLNRISEFISKHFIIAKSNNRMVWFCFDIVQSTSLEFDVNNLICFFPQLEPNQSAPPVVNLRHVLRNTSEIISTVEEGRNTALAVTVNTKKIVKEFFKGHSITSSRVQCHRLSSCANPTSSERFIVERLRCELDTLVKTMHALELSHIAILLDNNSVLYEFKRAINQMLSTNFNSVSQTIEESIIIEQKDRVMLDVAKNVASFESPCVIYIRTDNIGQVYRMISRARTRLTIIDVAESPLPYESIDHIEWSGCKTGFYNVSEVMDALHCKDMEQIGKLVSENPECLKLRQDGLTPFLLASQVGSVSTIKVCINHGADLYEKDPRSGQTSAMLAASYGHLEALKYLVLKGVSVKDKDKNGNTVFKHAVEGGNVECVEWVIQNYLHNTFILKKEVISVEMLQILRDLGTNLEKADKKGETILHHAVHNEQVECVRWIINNYPQSANTFGNVSILHDMASAGNLEMLQVLYDCGVCLDKLSNNGNTILDRALISRQKECLDWALQNYPQLVDASNNKASILHHLTKTGNLEVLVLLRDQGVTLEDVDSNGKTILHQAVYNQHIECVRWILQNYPQLPYVTNSNGSFIFHEIASAGNLEMLQVLHECGVCLDKVDNKGNTILDCAAIEEQEECLNWALQNYPQLVDASNNKTSILHKIACKGNIEILQTLLNQGISLEEADSNRSTILHHAVYNRQIECVRWIIQNYPSLLHIKNNEKSFIFHEMALAGNLEMLQMLHDCGVSLDEVDYNGNTILNYAVLRGDEECLKWILQNYPELPYIKNNENAFIFHVMASAGNLEMLQMLHDCGVSLDEVDYNGNTILNYAVLRGDEECLKWILQNYPSLPYIKNNENAFIFHVMASAGNLEMLQMLHDCGVSLDEVDDDGNTILDYAAASGQEECFKWVLQNYRQLFNNTLKGSKMSTFHHIAKNDHFKILEILRNEGVNLEQADSEGNTILHHAVSNRKYGCYVWILQNYPQLVEATKYKNSSILLEVASLDDYEMLDMLCIHEETSKDIKSQKSLLHKAAISHSAEELRTLIENEIKSDSCEAEETNVLLEKVDGDVTIFRDNGLVFKDSTVYLPLAWIYKGCKVYFEIEVMENMLTDNIFSIGLINSHFLPPENRRDEGVVYWVYWDSWLNKVGVKRYTIRVAIDMINCQILYEYAGESTKSITFPRLDDGLGLLPAVKGYDITLQVNCGAQEFKYSPPDSTYKSVEELIKGTNILHVAAKNNQADCCKYIIDTYPHLLNETSGRGTPLHECASTGSFESLKVLLDAGADMTITNIFGLTALDMAQINDHPGCVKELEGRLNVEEPSVSKGKKSLLSRLKESFRKK